MRPIAARGYTLPEALAVLAILGIVLAMGLPRLGDWVAANRAQSAAGFYAEGLQLARAQALTHNSASRMVLVTHEGGAQPDWRVDICFPTPATPCDDASGDWSTVSAAAEGDPEGAQGYTSLLRSATALPTSATLSVSVTPEDATAAYFTPTGWVNTAVAPRLERLTLAPAADHAGSFATSAVVLTLAGAVTTCDPQAGAQAARGCPP